MLKTNIHIITNFSQVGGAEEMLIRHINSVEETRCVIISLMDSSGLMTDKLRSNVEVITLNCNSAFDLLLAPFKLLNVLKNYQPDVLYSWMYHANFVTALAKFFSAINTPLIWGVRHSLDDLKGESMSTKLAIYAGKLLKSIPDKVVYCANRAMQQHVEFGYSTIIKSVYIPNGYNFTKYQPRTFDDNNIVIGAAGRFHEAKDYYTLIKAVAPILKANANIKLRIAGRDVVNGNHTLTNYIKKESISFEQVELLGQISNMSEFYNSVDFFVLSSKTEGFPNVLAEAAGSGCITFSTDVGDASLIVNDEQRLAVIGDAYALENLLAKYINMPSGELVEISKKSAAFIRNTYSIEAISQKLLEIGNNN
ncbi:glycosyltransferase [Colwellia psychrerythraea]|uniref:Glycosyl transferase group 1 n=1 Tax=Colwellia psychrerythraea TaxID=28229 RepID=A0A099KI12_COLPS|nr:glycosyltransferase [Colwellia psychrerythraea]KGJ89905.1 glycosyl transferase group 1 [Colwellia psychrerythraea]